MQPNRPVPKFALDVPSQRHTRNIPLKEVLASCEITPAWPKVLDKLTDGTPIEKAPTFLQELAREKVLARK